MKTLILLSIASLSFALATEARAEGTPDLMSPSAESICDGYEGKSWGLCNAYCEAMDCELANDGDPSTNPNASAQACEQVANKFDQVSGGAQLPCEVPECPCLAYDGFVAALEASGPADYCLDYGTYLVSEDVGSWGVAVVNGGDFGYCGWYSNPDYGYGAALITGEEAQACIDYYVGPALYTNGACGG